MLDIAFQTYKTLILDEICSKYGYSIYRKSIKRVIYLSDKFSH